MLHNTRADITADTTSTKVAMSLQEDLYGAYEAACVGGVNFFDTAEASHWDL